MYLLFDIGGTTTRIAVSKDGHRFADPKTFETPEHYEEGLAKLKELAEYMLEGKKVEGAAGGVAGPLDRAHTTLVNSPNLPHWVDKPLKRDLEELFHTRVFLENDTAVVGLGEALEGAGQGYDITAYVTVSTGVGGVRIVNGRIDKNSFGFEIGHQIVDMNGPMCPGCEMPGHLEGYISGASLSKRYGKKPSEIEDPAVWDEAARILAVGLNNVMVHWSPDVIVLGGSLVRHGPPEFFKLASEYFRKTIKIFPILPRVERGILGDIGGLHGALMLLHQSLEKYRS